MTKLVEGPASPASNFLAGVAIALDKRRKAIRYSLRNLKVESCEERLSDEEPDKLEITGKLGRTNLRLFVWEDRWVFVDARTPMKGDGWAWESTHEGRLTAGDAQVLVNALEASIAAASGQSSDEFERVWKPLLATGPRLAR